jgi:serine/threonine-protein kinase
MLVDTINATAVTVADKIYGDVNQTFQLADARPVRDYIRDFDLDTSYKFVGRSAVFEALDDFAAKNPAGYFEIVADAGLGKTALAIEIARRHDAVVFLASAGSNAHRPEQFLEHVSADLIVRHQLDYATLPARAGDDATFLSRILGESVRAAGGPVWVVVDGLDEADPPSPGANPLLLPSKLPDRVYMVVTRRTGRLLTKPGTRVRRYTLRRDDPLQIADIEEFVRDSVARDGRIADALVSGDPPVSPDDFVTRLVGASEGNFMYVSYVLADLAERGPETPPLDLFNLPPGLEGYYDQFWDWMSSALPQGWPEWEGLYLPIIGCLAVAREAVTADWLAAQVGRSPNEVRVRVLEPWARVLNQGRQGDWRLVHRTFGEFLEKKLDMREAHRKVAEYYAVQRWGQFGQWDLYGLRHTATHLAEAAGLSTGQQRHELIALLARLVTEQGFQQAHLAMLHDPALLRRDLELAYGLTATDEHPDATFLLVPVALTIVLFHRRLLRPEAMFAAARDGNVPAAERLLDLFSGQIDSAWHDTILLTIAWLAAEKAPAEAARVRNRVRGTQPSSPTLIRLLERVTAALDGTPPPPAFLPRAPSRGEAARMVARLGGAGGSSLLGGQYELLAQGHGELRDRDAGGYLATLDGPPLVALAKEEPGVGEPLLERYLDVHRAYGYPQYRNGSLWELLAAVLLHPSQDWVREWLTRVDQVVLAAPNRGEFLESLVIAVLALQADAGDSEAKEELARHRDAAVDQALALPPSPVRGEGDAWGLHRRRLAGLAEAYSRFPLDGSNPADLVAGALALGRGFAGITAPASLTLAETASVAAPGDASSMIERALTAAEEAAHNIQDATFCARTTARVAAMRERWWSGPQPFADQVAQVIGRLARDQSSPEFSAVHVVGESYSHRDPVSRALMPERMLTAATLDDLAWVYQRPIEEFLRHNEGHGWAPGEHLPNGTRVNVPDPGFQPLIAARLSAAVLSGGPPGPSRSALLRQLVPVTGADVTALATVIARLLLCSPTQDALLLKELRDLVTKVASATAVEQQDHLPQIPS